MFKWRKVPARVGGVDLSNNCQCITVGTAVPARVGGVDLSCAFRRFAARVSSPRPCGRGGFKLLIYYQFHLTLMSPPVWAGWI